jgi:basic amino acid/polyamine antiporter, APA family
MPALPIASVVACAWLMLNLSVLTWIRFGVWMAAGLLIYLLYGRTHSVLARRQRGNLTDYHAIHPM